MSKVHLVAATAMLFLSAPARADADLRKRLSKPIAGVLNSTKPPPELQLCAADAVGEGLLPLVFPPDIAGTVHIFGFGGLMGAGTVQRVVSLVKTPKGTRVEVRTRTGRTDPALTELLESCL